MPRKALLGIQEKSGGFCDPAVGLLFFCLATLGKGFGLSPPVYCNPHFNP